MFIFLHNIRSVAQLASYSRDANEHTHAIARYKPASDETNLSLKFTEIHPKSSFKIIRSSSREIFGSHGGDEVFWALTPSGLHRPEDEDTMICQSVGV